MFEGTTGDEEIADVFGEGSLGDGGDGLCGGRGHFQRSFDPGQAMIGSFSTDSFSWLNSPLGLNRLFKVMNALVPQIIVTQHAGSYQHRRSSIEIEDPLIVKLWNALREHPLFRRIPSKALKRLAASFTLQSHHTEVGLDGSLSFVVKGSLMLRDMQRETDLAIVQKGSFIGEASGILKHRSNLVGVVPSEHKVVLVASIYKATLEESLGESFYESLRQATLNAYEATIFLKHPIEHSSNLKMLGNAILTVVAGAIIRVESGEFRVCSSVWSDESYVSSGEFVLEPGMYARALSESVVVVSLLGEKRSPDSDLALSLMLLHPSPKIQLLYCNKLNNRTVSLVGRPFDWRPDLLAQMTLVPGLLDCSGASAEFVDNSVLTELHSRLHFNRLILRGCFRLTTIALHLESIEVVDCWSLRDFGSLSAVNLSLEGCPRFDDEQASKLKGVTNLLLSHCQSLSDTGLRSLLINNPNLTTLSLIRMPSLTQDSLNLPTKITKIYLKESLGISSYGWASGESNLKELHLVRMPEVKDCDFRGIGEVNLEETDIDLSTSVLKRTNQ